MVNSSCQEKQRKYIRTSFLLILFLILHPQVNDLPRSWPENWSHQQCWRYTASCYFQASRNFAGGMLTLNSVSDKRGHCPSTCTHKCKPNMNAYAHMPIQINCYLNSNISKLDFKICWKPAYLLMFLLICYNPGMCFDPSKHLTSSNCTLMSTFKQSPIDLCKNRRHNHEKSLRHICTSITVPFFCYDIQKSLKGIFKGNNLLYGCITFCQLL